MQIEEEKMNDILSEFYDLGKDKIKDSLKNTYTDIKIKDTIKKYIEDHKNEMYSAIGEAKADRLFEYINNNFLEDIQAYLLGNLNDFEKKKSTIFEKAIGHAGVERKSQQDSVKNYIDGLINAIIFIYGDQVENDRKFIAIQSIEEISKRIDANEENVQRILEEYNKEAQRDKQRNSEESLSKASIQKLLTEICETKKKESLNSSISLNPLESGLYTNIKGEDKEYIASENKTSLLKKIQEQEQEGRIKRNLLVIGEGGIGKTATMLGCCQELIDKGELCFYVPLRNVDVRERTLWDYIQNEELKGSDNRLTELVRQKLNGNDKECSKLYLFLDGANEMNIDSVWGEKFCTEINNFSDCVQIVISSRRTLEEDGIVNLPAQRINMKRLTQKQVSEYLKANNLEVPDEKVLCEILGLPLMLKIYTFVKKNVDEIGISRNIIYRWKNKIESKEDLFSNYIQCQIYNGPRIWNTDSRSKRNYNATLKLILVGEYLAPYVASRMNLKRSYIASMQEILQWVHEGWDKLCNSEIIKEDLDERLSLSNDIEFPDDIRQTFSAKSQIINCMYRGLGLVTVNRSEKIEVQFIHQDFQDMLNLFYIKKSFEHCEQPFYQNAISEAKLPYDMITLLNESLSDKKLEDLIESYRNKSPDNLFGVYNLIEVLKRRKNNDLSEVNLSGLDLKNARLTGCILNGENKHTIFSHAKFSTKTFGTEGHSAPVAAVDFCNSGGKFVSASYDKSVRIWDAATGKCLAILEGHSHFVRCVSWSSSVNDDLIVSGGDDQRLIIWNVTDCLEDKTNIIKSPFQVIEKDSGHKGWILCVAWSAGGTVFASADSRGIICVWKQNGNKKFEKRCQMKVSMEAVKCLSWSLYDKYLLVCGCEDGKLCFIKLSNDTSQYTIVTLIGIQEAVTALDWSPDGKMIAAGCGKKLLLFEVKQFFESDNEIIQFDSLKENRCLEVTVNHKISNVKWTKEFFIIADGEDLIFRGLEQTEIYSRIRNAHKSNIKCLTWSEFERKLISGGDDSSLRIWKARNPSWNNDWTCVQCIEGGGVPTCCVAWSEDSSEVVAGYEDNMLRIWNVNKKRCRLVIRGHENRIKCVDWIQGLIVSGANDNRVIVWDSRTGRRKAVMEKHNGAVNCVRWLPDHKHVVSGSDDNTLIIWNYESNEKKVLRGHTDKVYGIVLSKDARILASVSNDMTVRFWNVETGEELKNRLINTALKGGHSDNLRCVGWSPSSDNLLITGSNDTTLKFWNAQKRNLRQKNNTLAGHKDFVYCLSWSPDGNYIVSGSTDNTLIIWNCREGRKIDFLTEHSNYVHGVSWAPDGEHIASASNDGNVIIWKKRGEKFTSICCFEAISFLDIVNCHFEDAYFETEGLKSLIMMNGGICN